MTEGRRRLLFLAGAAFLAPLLVWAMVGLPDFGHPTLPYGDVLTQLSINERHVTSAVGAIVFDLRGFDTLGEELILLVAAAAVGVVLREQRDESELEPDEADGEQRRVDSDALRYWALLLVGPLLLLGASLAAHGHLTPGGGFQGGVVIASAVLLLYLGRGFDAFRRLSVPSALEPAEAVGAGAYVAIGLAGLVASGAFLANVLGLGQPGVLLSGGIVAPLNIAVGLEVAGGVLLLLDELLAQWIVVRRRNDR